MRDRFLTRVFISVLLAIFAYVPAVCFANDGVLSNCGQEQHLVAITNVCDSSLTNREVGQALQLVCDRSRISANWTDTEKVIVIGFLGGFVKRSDRQHPEVWFADYLRQHYSSPICVAVYSNHERRAAEKRVMRILDTNSDGTLSDSEKKQAKIIVFGHSWGASETTAFARDLGHRGIPVLLTIQIDIVPKPFQKPSIIPSNVEQAINLFQSEGLLRGREPIVAEDPAKTRILGNIRLTYGDNPIDCQNFPWFARTFNKPHHEIENDQQVWELVRNVIDVNLGQQTQARIGAPH